MTWRVSSKWSAEQDRVPYYRFSTDHSNGSDPGENTEAVGDIDAVTATSLGMKTLERVMDNMLVKATTAEPGETYDDLTEIYVRHGIWGELSEPGLLARL